MRSGARQAITVAVIALIGALGAATINVLPSFCSRKEAAKGNGVSVSSSTVQGSVVGRDQNTTVQIFIASEADLQRLSEVFKALPPPTAKKVRAELIKEEKKEVALNSVSNHPPNGKKRTVTEPTFESEEATPSPLEEVFYKRLEQITRLGFYVSPTNSDFTVDHRSVFKVMVPVTKDLEYVIVALGSPSIGVLREYVFDETGKAIKADLKSTANQGFYSFRAKESGTVEVFLEADQVDGASQIFCAVGRRGNERAPAEGFEPAFDMHGDEDSESPAVSPSPFM